MKTPLNNVETFNVTNTTDTNNNDVALDRLFFFMIAMTQFKISFFKNAVSTDMCSRYNGSLALRSEIRAVLRLQVQNYFEL